MNYFKHLGNVAKTIGSASIVPGVSNAVNRFVDNTTGETQEERIKALEAEVASGRKTRQQAKLELGMKKGGKVSSASKRADGCAQRGKTKGKMV
jgi:glucose-6-phosphate dehydrogenase assembly protein OpcA